MAYGLYHRACRGALVKSGGAGRLRWPRRRGRAGRRRSALPHRNGTWPDVAIRRPASACSAARDPAGVGHQHKRGADRQALGQVGRHAGLGFKVLDPLRRARVHVVGVVAGAERRGQLTRQRANGGVRAGRRAGQPWEQPVRSLTQTSSTARLASRASREIVEVVGVGPLLRLTGGDVQIDVRFW